jgi:hypothetical protein
MLRDAANHIEKLSKAEQAKPPHWQAAIEALIMAAEDRGPLLHARVGMLRADYSAGLYLPSDALFSCCKPSRLLRKRTGNRMPSRGWVTPAPRIERSQDSPASKITLILVNYRVSKRAKIATSSA